MACPASTVLVLAGTSQKGWPYGDQIAFSLPAAGPIQFRWSAVPAVPGLTWRFLNSGGFVVAETPNTTPPSGLTNPFTLPAGAYTLWLTTAAICGVGANSHPCNQVVTFSITGACATPCSANPCPAGCTCQVSGTGHVCNCPPPGCPHCGPSQYCNAATGFKCVACSPACAAGGICGPNVNGCTCPEGQCCPPCPAGYVCHGASPGVLSSCVACAPPNVVINNQCVGGPPPPPPAGISHTALLVGLGAAALGGLYFYEHRHTGQTPEVVQRSVRERYLAPRPVAVAAGYR